MAGPQRIDERLEAEPSDLDELHELDEGAEAAVADLEAEARFVRLEGRKFPNTDALPTQPLRLLRWVEPLPPARRREPDGG